MTERELEFMGKIIDIFGEVETLTKEYGYEDKIMSAMVFGLIDEVYEKDDGNNLWRYGYFTELKWKDLLERSSSDEIRRMAWRITLA